MAKVARILFNTNYYDQGAVKYEKGKHYPVTPQTATCVLAGHAEEVTVDMPTPQAQTEAADAAAALAAEREATTKAEAAAKRGGDAGENGAVGEGL